MVCQILAGLQYDPVAGCKNVENSAILFKLLKCYIYLIIVTLEILYYASLIAAYIVFLAGDASVIRVKALNIVFLSLVCSMVQYISTLNECKLSYCFVIVGADL